MGYNTQCLRSDSFNGDGHIIESVQRVKGLLYGGPHVTEANSKDTACVYAFVSFSVCV